MLPILVSMKATRTSGFTLMELMVTLALAAIIVGLAIPNMRDFIRNNRLTGAANDLLHSLQVARTEAIKRQSGNAVVCGTADPTVADAALTCSYNSFAGWFVFQDLDGDWAHGGAEPVIERHALVDPTVTVIANQDRIVSYAPTGFANPGGFGRLPTSNVVICDQRGTVAIGRNTVGATSAARAVRIQPTGRARVSNVQADVTAAKTAIGLNCP